jgi:long-chain acyl-CoA synthetase
MEFGDLYLDDIKTERAVFQQRVLKLAKVLSQHGVGEDDVIGALLYNDPVYMEVFEACRHIGAYFVTLNWHGSASELAQIIADADAKLLIGHANLLASFTNGNELSIPFISVPVKAPLKHAYGLSDLPKSKHIDLDDALQNADEWQAAPLRNRGMMAYTSGSTGKPKGIRRKLDPDRPDSYDTFTALAETLMQLSQGDRFYTPAPLYHSAPNALTSMCVAFGGVDVHLSPRFDAEQFLRDIERLRITHAYIVPTMMVRLLKLPQEIRDKYDTSSWRYSLTTGSAWPKDIKDAMIEWFGPIFYETYGASEIGFMTLISSQESIDKPGSVGKVLPGGSVKILDDHGNELPPGETGTIYMHLPMFGDFNYSNVDKSEEDFRYGEFTSVGDVGHVDEEGYVYISDRKKDMIISGGANIFPAEIEAALIEMSEVLDCAVFGVPHAEFGESVVAAVEVLDGATVSLESVTQFLQPKLARFKIPRAIEVHDKLPREDSGKIFKQRLRAPHWAGVERNI